MDRKQFFLFILLSAAVIIGWQVVMRRYFPAPTIDDQAETSRPSDYQPAQSNKPPIAAPDKTAIAAQPNKTTAAAATKQEKTQASERELTVDTPYWTIKFNSRGAVATSWILKKDKKPNGVDREIKSANGTPLELIPQEAVEPRIYPLSLRTPWSPDIGDLLNNSNFKIEGVPEGQTSIDIASGQRRDLIFIYSSGQVESRKTFSFSGDDLVFKAATSVRSGATEQPVEIVIGPRIGDQSDTQTGSYSTPPQIIGTTLADKTDRIIGARATPPFGSIVGINQGERQITIDKPVNPDISLINIVSSAKDKEPFFIATAKVVDRDNTGRVLTLDQIPTGARPENGVAQAVDTIRSQFRWAGMVNHYFAMIAVPESPINEIALSNINLMSGDGSRVVRSYPLVAIPDNGTLRIFVGPKDRDLLAYVGSSLGVDLGSLIDYGIFSPVIRPLVPVIGAALDLGVRLFHNYGWGIVFVTLVLNLVLSPLRLQSSKKMKQAAKHQPRLKELQDRMKRLKADASKKNERELEQLQREQMEIMKEANPLGGCLPMLLQMPVFWAIFVYLTISLDVRGAPWILWVTDLSAPDRLHILPIVMCVTMIAQSLIQPMPQSTDPSQKMQKMMMTWLMPIVLTYFFFFSAPSGLVLYWMVSNVAGAGIQYLINQRTKPADEAAPPPGAPSPVRTGGPKSGGKRFKPRAPEKEIAGSIK